MAITPMLPSARSTPVDSQALELSRVLLHDLICLSEALGFYDYHDFTACRDPDPETSVSRP